MQTSLTHCINSYCKALPSSRYQRDVILNSADEWITMGLNQSEGTSHPLSLRFLTSFSKIVVLSILWCFVFFLIFSICLFLFNIYQNKKQKSQPNGDDEVTDADVSSNEVSEKMKKRGEKNKSYKERVNSVYFEWFKDH